MTFQIKDFRSIAASLINLMRANQSQITDFSVGSVARTLMEAPAAELEQLYMQMLLGLQESIPVAIYRAFNFTRLAAAPATGVLQIDITSQSTDTIIPANTAFTVDGSGPQYRTQVDLVITAGETSGTVLAACDDTGPNGNVEAGQTFAIVSSFSAFVSATNPGPFTGGAGIETDDQRQQRFADFILAIAKSHLAGIKYGLSLAKLYDEFGLVTEQARYSVIVEPYLADSAQPVGWFVTYIHNGVDGASAALIARAVEILHGYYNPDGSAVPGYKAAGVKADVHAATSLATNVSASIVVLDGFDGTAVRALIVAAITNYLQGLDIGVKAVHAELVAIIMSIPGVYNTTVTSPAADVIPTATQKIMPGNVYLGTIIPGTGSLSVTGKQPTVTKT